MVFIELPLALPCFAKVDAAFETSRASQHNKKKIFII